MGMVGDTCNPSPQEVEVEESLPAEASLVYVEFQARQDHIGDSSHNKTKHVNKIKVIMRPDISGSGHWHLVGLQHDG